jgi:DNA-binding beta-propeller fold protein YncE
VLLGQTPLRLVFACGLALLVAALGSPAFAQGTLTPGDIYVADPSAASGSGAVIRIHPINGAQTLVSSGGLFSDPVGIAISQAGEIYVVDSTAFGGNGGVIRVNPTTGAQTPVSSGGRFEDPTGIAIAANGDLLVSDFT